MLDRPAFRERIRAWLRWLAAAGFVVAGSWHFAFPQVYYAMMSPSFPTPGVLVALSGVAFVVSGAGLLVAACRRVAAWLAIGTLVAVFPVNVYLALEPRPIAGHEIPAWLFWLRLPLQALLVAWVWFVALSRGPVQDQPALRVVSADSDAPEEPRSQRERPGAGDWLLPAATVSYMVSLAALWGAMRWLADYHWWATLLLFMPRWIWATPAPLLIAAAWHQRRSWRWSIYCSLLLLLVMCFEGVRLDWRAFWPGAARPPRLRVLSLNCDGWSLQPEALKQVIADADPDVVALQDIAVRHLRQIFPDPVWYLNVSPHLTLASRHPLGEDEMVNDPRLRNVSGEVHRYTLHVDNTNVQFVNVHFSTPRFGLLAVKSGGLTGAQSLQAASDQRRAQAETVCQVVGESAYAIIAGDFNTPVESAVFHDNFGAFGNAFSTAGWGQGNTYFSRWTCLRLDEILYSQPWQCERCWVGPFVGSEHRPLIAELSTRPIE